jgi:hypothetical protein
VFCEFSNFERCCTQHRLDQLTKKEGEIGLCSANLFSALTSPGMGVYGPKGHYNIASVLKIEMSAECEKKLTQKQYVALMLLTMYKNTRCHILAEAIVVGSRRMSNLTYCLSSRSICVYDRCKSFTAIVF